MKNLSRHWRNTLKVYDEYKEYWKTTGRLSDALYKVGSNEQYEIEGQYNFMLSVGLKPNHLFLDFGCGCLRGTGKLVGYLDNGNYFGADISESLLEQGQSWLDVNGINKTPILVPLSDYDLEKYFHEKFDYVLAVSVFTHTDEDTTFSIMKGVKSILKPNGQFYFTTIPAKDENVVKGYVGLMMYGKEVIRQLCLEAGLRVVELEGEYPNPTPSNHVMPIVNQPYMGQWTYKAWLMDTQ